MAIWVERQDMVSREVGQKTSIGKWLVSGTFQGGYQRIMIGQGSMAMNSLKAATVQSSRYMLPCRK